MSKNDELSDLVSRFTKVSDTAVNRVLDLVRNQLKEERKKENHPVGRVSIDRALNIVDVIQIEWNRPKYRNIPQNYHLTFSRSKMNEDKRSNI